jgi:hypothetical protein
LTSCESRRRDLHQDAVGALAQDRGLAGAHLVDAAANDLERLLDGAVVGGGRSASESWTVRRSPVAVASMSEAPPPVRLATGWARPRTISSARAAPSGFEMRMRSWDGSPSSRG